MTSNASSEPVLIAGAGPSGLVLALSLARRGIPVRIIDKNSGPGQASRAIAVHARTLEFYRQLGFADEVVAAGVKTETAGMRRDGKDVARVNLKDMGGDLSPFPFVLCYGQDDHERLLVKKLAAAGVTVEWGVELKSFTEDGNGVRAVLAKNGVEETAAASYLCGCDGAHSAVRKGLNIDFPGGDYKQLFFVADVTLEKNPGANLTINLGDKSFVLVMPVRAGGDYRLIGIVPEEAAAKAKLTFEDVRQKIEPLAGVKVAAVNWFSTYHVHHRVASTFRQGRCFLVGDAGHIHSPAGGQGMNTGIGDAVNLAWKLADVLKGRAAPALLDTYETERIGFARELVATTDKAFQAMVAGGLKGKFLRAWLLPLVLPLVTGFATVRRKMFKTVSQVMINYRGSSLSEGKAGALEGGDRLPWAAASAAKNDNSALAGGDNFAPLQSLDWQLHVYGAVSPALAQAAKKLDLPLHRLPADDVSKKAGIRADAAYLVRPDGYIALALADQNPQKLAVFVKKHGLSFGGAAGFSPASKPPSPRPPG